MPGLHQSGRPVAASGCVSPTNRTMMMMKKAGKSAVRVSIAESASPYRCMNMAAIIRNFGIAITVRMVRVMVVLRSTPTAATSISVRTISPKKFIQ